MAEGYVEFYITTNPPLLPNGVSSIIKYALGDLQPDKAVEILYEPDIPWFKIISPIETQADVYLWFETHLERSLELDLGAFSPELQDDSDFEELDEPGPDPDIEIVQPDAHVVSWARYQEKSYAGDTEYDEHRYPEPLTTLKYKRVYRDLQSVDNLTLSNLLSEFRFLWDDAHTSVGLERIGALSKCEITHNMSGTLVYVGSDHHARSPEYAVQKLARFLRYRDAKSSGTLHLVFTEGTGTFEIFQSYLSHLGLFRMTYVEAHHPEPKVEYQRMTEATSLRVAILNSRDHWTIDQSKYASKTHPDVLSWKPFSAFQDCTYRDRMPFGKPLATRQLSAPSSLPPIGPSSPAINRDPSVTDSSVPVCSSVSQQPDLSDTRGAEASLATSLNLIASPKKQEQQKIISAEKEAHIKVLQLPLAPSLDTNLPPSPVEIDPRASDLVSSWIATVEKPELLEDIDIIDFKDDDEQPISGETSEALATGLVDDGQLLIDLSLEPDADSSLSASLMRLDDAIVETDTTSSFLIDLEPLARAPKVPQSPTSFEDILDRDSPRKQSYDMFTPMNPLTLTEHNNLHPALAPANTSTQNEETTLQVDLLDSSGPYIYTAALMDSLGSRSANGSGSHSHPPLRGNKALEDDNSIATFQLKSDSEKDFIETMGQRASNGSSSWAQIASKAKKSTAKPASNQMFGPNVKVNIAERAGGPSRTSEKGKSTSIPQSPTPVRSAMGNGHGSTLQPSVEVQPPVAQPQSSLGQKRAASQQLFVPGLGSSSQSPPKQVVPGLESSSQSPQKRSRRHNPASEGHKAVLQAAITEVQNLMRILQIIPGCLIVQARFGRACIKGLPTSVVGPSTRWLPVEVARELNEREGGDDCLSFCTTLTTNGEEAEVLLHTQNLKGGKWVFAERKTFYDIRCGHEQQPRPLLIEVNADTLEYHCRQGGQQDLSSLVIHCAQRAWDIQVCLARVIDEVSDEFRDFAQELVSSLGIKTHPDGKVIIDLSHNGVSPYSVNGLEVRRLAKYHNRVNGSCLTVTNTIRVDRVEGSWKNKSSYHGSVCRVSRPGVPEAEPPTSWFEASIKSNNLQEVLKENIGLELGEETRWQGEHLDKLVEEILDPALRMVTQMDDIGRTNNNGYRTALNQPLHDPVAAEKARDPDYCYW